MIDGNEKEYSAVCRSIGPHAGPPLCGGRRWEVQEQKVGRWGKEEIRFSNSNSNSEKESRKSDGGSTSSSGSSSGPAEHEGGEESGNECGVSEGTEGSAEAEGYDDDDDEGVDELTQCDTHSYMQQQLAQCPRYRVLPKMLS